MTVLYWLKHTLAGLKLHLIDDAHHQHIKFHLNSI